MFSRFLEADHRKHGLSTNIDWDFQVQQLELFLLFLLAPAMGIWIGMFSWLPHQINNDNGSSWTSRSDKVGVYMYLENRENQYLMKDVLCDKREVNK